MKHSGAHNALEQTMHLVFLLFGVVTIGFVLLISIYLIAAGLPAIREIGLVDFLFGKTWASTAAEPKFGILPFILTSIYGTAGAILIGVPVGFMTAVFLAKVAPRPLAGLVRPAVDLLAGIPSVVYGFFGLMVVVPMIIQVFGGTGNSLLATILILAAMILPTMVSLSETAVRAVPQAYREGSLALGATHMQTIFRVTLPAAKSGVLNAFVLSLGRAIGETMAVILVAGNRASIPTSILDPVRPMTANIALELSYANGLHAEALYATGVVLLVFIVIINITAHIVLRNKKEG